MNSHPDNPKTHLSTREQITSAVFFTLSALAAAPTYWHGNPCGHDTATHFWRAVMFTFNVREGYPFLQWSQHFLRGYGYPIFPFYAPLFNWLIAFLHLIGLDVNAALRTAAWLALVVCGWSMYTLTRRYVDTPQAAAVAGLAYMFAPYIIYDGVERGALPELWALALAPWVLARVDVALERQTGRSAVLAILAFALLILTHNVIPIITFLLAGALWLGRLQAKQWLRWWHDARLTVLIIAGSLAVTSFFWLPALIELDDTQQGLDTPADFVDSPVWFRNFLPETELITFPADPADPQLGNPPLIRTLGLPQAILAGLGLLTLLWHKKRRGTFLMWGIIILTAIALSNANTSLLWEILPLQTFVQLPTRLLGIASLGLAVLTGRAIDELQRLTNTIAWPTTAVLALAVCMVGWPWLTRPYCDFPSNPDRLTLATAARWNSDQTVRAWGGANGAETLPRWSNALPDPDQLIPQYETDAPINRLLLPETAVISNWENRPNGDSYQLQLAEPITATYQAFYMPGWQATVNGQPATLTPNEPFGLMTLSLPAGTAELDIHFGRTPLRWVMITISALVLCALLWLGRRRDTTNATLSFDLKTTLPTFALILLLILPSRAAVALTDNPLQASRLEFADAPLALTERPHRINFSNELINLGVNGTFSAPADETLAFTQYWTPAGNLGVQYNFDLRIADENGRQWSLPARRPIFHSGIPGVNGWQTSFYERDPYLLDLLPGTPPGTYWLETTVFRKDITFALTAENAPTAPDPAWARLTQIEILPPQNRPELTPENASVQTTHQEPLTQHPELTLYGSSLITFPPIRPYDQLLLELLWQTEGQLSNAVQVDVTLQDDAQQTITTDSIAVGGDYATNSWGSNALIRQQTGWSIPRELPSGRYTLLIDDIVIGSFEVNAPDRQLNRPDTAATATIPFGFTQLTGYTLSDPIIGQPLTIDLLWQAQQPTDINYRVFVHLRDENGQIIAQSDAEPAQWSRPTRGWLPPEWVLDTHTMIIPPDKPAGSYQIAIGLYNPATMERLGDAVLTTIDIQ